MNYKFSSMMQHFQSSAVREILKLTQGKSIISFAGGLPAEELFPMSAMQAAFNRVFDMGNHALQYGLTEGFTLLREALSERMERKNMHVTKDQMMLTTGSQQAIDLLTRVYIDPGDVILVQQPTYLAALQVFQSRGAIVKSVSGDAEGMDLDDLAFKIRTYKPKMLYVCPTFSNPTGYVWNAERRQGLLKQCKENDILILEDDPYGELKYGKEDYPSIFSYEEKAEGSAVVYTSTFSKTAAPALRTGWVMGDSEVIRSMAKAKQASDLHSSTMDQMALYQLLTGFDLDAHIETIRGHYHSRMNLMTELLEDLRKYGLKWNNPKGGMFLWVELPEGLKAEELLKEAVQQGVAFVPGSSFYADTPKFNTMRLNFTHADRDTMTLGMNRLAAALELVQSKQI